MTRMIAGMLIIALLPACSHAPQSSTPPALSLPRPGVHLVATPDRAKACGVFNFHVHFDWTVSNQRSSQWYDLHVDSPTGSLLASGGRNWHADTGAWAHVGQWFFLVAPETQEVVAAVRIGPDDCAQ